MSMMIKFQILTLFPNIFDSYFNESIIKRAKEKKKIKLAVLNIRDFAKDKHKTVDGRPYGGGPGMVLKIEPIFKALQKAVGKKKLFGRFVKPKINPIRNSKLHLSKTMTHLTKQISISNGKKDTETRIILTDPDGKIFTEIDAKRLAKYKNLVIICGHYEGVDARAEKLIDEKISIGNYILTGGELAAMVIVDAVSRLAPGVLGNAESLADSLNYNFKQKKSGKKVSEFKKPCFDSPHYTRPEIFSPDKKTVWRVPKVLLSGNAEKIKTWRNKFLKK